MTRIGHGERPLGTRIPGAEMYIARRGLPGATATMTPGMLAFESISSDPKLGGLTAQARYIGKRHARTDARVRMADRGGRRRSESTGCQLRMAEDDIAQVGLLAAAGRLTSASRACSWGPPCRLSLATDELTCCVRGLAFPNRFLYVLLCRL